MEFNEVITFEGGINTDDNPQAIPKGDYRDFSYCRIGYNAGNALAVTTSNGTIEINNPDIGVNDRILGATPWQKTNSIVYFVYKADLNHQIWMYSITNQTHTKVLESSVLNFNVHWPIYHANVIDDILKWTDGRWDPLMYDTNGTRLFNPPYQINLRKALDGYYTFIDLQTIDAIKWPLDPPRVSYFTDPTRNDNKLRNKLFKFIIQPIYENDELGVWSMYSNLDLPERSEFVTGTNWVFGNNSNGIKIQFNTGSNIIRKFNLAVQQFDKDSFGAEPPFGIFLQLDKNQDNIPDNSWHTIDFYGGVATIPAVDVLKNYDRLPIVADCQEYLPTNELTYINFREGYNKPSELYELINVNVDYELTEINWRPPTGSSFFEALVLNLGGPVIQIYSVPTDPTANPYAYFLFESETVYSLGGISPSLLYFSPSIEDINYALSLYGTGAGGYSESNRYILQLLGDAYCNILGIPTGTASYVGFIKYEVAYPGGLFVTTAVPLTANRMTYASPSLKVGATHEFGIVYGDRAYRDSTVYTVDSMNLFVPWFYDIDKAGFNNADNPFLVNPKFTINHVPPIWATKYWIVAKPATEILSFGQYTTNANDITTGYISSIKLDNDNYNRYIIEIDNYYETQNIGASIRHEIKIGDKVRFIRRRIDLPMSSPSQAAYLPYLELDVIGYDLKGNNGRKRVFTNLFDTNLIENGWSLTNNQLFGQLIEIYTPRPSIDSTGNVFVSTWKDITEAIEIINPHTSNRSHGSPCEYILYVETNVIGTPQFYIQGDYTNLNNTSFNVFVYYDNNTSDSFSDVTITATFNQINNLTVITIPGVAADNRIWYVCLTNNIDQVVTDLVSTTSAQFSISYGDVYIRQRDYQTGYANENAAAYYYIEDPHYSDYWSSKIYNDGRLRIEDPNARMTHRQATAIHSDSFIVGTQINGLSSFALDNQNIKNMNPTFGPVIRALMSGREGKTLKCLQQRKENSIYIQYYPNEVGSDSTVRVSNTTFASWFDYKSLFGCSNPGAIALLPNGAAMYFDNRAGVFIYSGANGQIVVSEIDQDNKTDYKFRTKTKALAAAYNASPNPIVRTYVNESVGEVGFAFNFDETYDHVVFDYVNMRWRSTYDYNFQQFCNLGQTLVGWGVDNQLYLHNQLNQWTFHGQAFTQKVSFVSNEQPLMLKRYQDITLVSDDLFSIEAQSEPNRSYPLGMKTLMSTNLINTYEGYGKVNYRKNLYDPKFYNAANVSTANIGLNGWTFAGDYSVFQTYPEMVTINQTNIPAGGDGNIYTGMITSATYDPINNWTVITLAGQQPTTDGAVGTWFLSQIPLLNGEDIRANALTHTLEYDPTINGTGSILVSVGIKGVLS